MSACKVRPLTQTGLWRIPSNAKARQIGEGGLPIKGNALDAINERLAERDLRLHPTKGYRPLTPRLTTLEMITAQRRNGVPWSMARIRQVLAA